MKRSVMITGAKMGTGYRIAETFAREGWDVVLTSRNGEDAQRAAGRLAEEYGIRAEGFACDIGSEEQVCRIFSRLDELGYAVETLVLNAADLGFGKDPARGQDFFTVPIEEVRRVFETNLVWNFTLVRQAALRMRERNRGAVVFVSSNTAYRAIPNRTAYCASKGGINAMTRALAVELGPYGIRVNAVLPGTIKTERWEQMGGVRLLEGKKPPLGDISDFDDIANAVYFLGTDSSKNVTGTELTVDGGASCQLFPRE